MSKCPLITINGSQSGDIKRIIKLKAALKTETINNIFKQRDEDIKLKTITD